MPSAPVGQFAPFSFFLSSVIICTELCTHSVQAQTWEPVGEAGFSPNIAYHHALALDNDVPHAAFLDFEVVKISVMKHGPFGWEFLGNQGFSDGGTFDRIAMDFVDGVPYVAYSDHAHDNKLTVMHYDNNVWSALGGAGFTPGAVSSVSLVCHDGVPFVAFSDGANEGKATLMTYDGALWTTVGNPGFSEGLAFQLSLAFDGDLPIVAFTDASQNNALTAVRFEGNAWTTIGNPGFTPPSASGPDLAISDGAFFVAFTDNSVFPYRASVMAFSGTDWQYVGGQYCSPAAAPDVRLALNNQTPHVLFTDQTQDFKTTCVGLNGNDWEPLGLPGFSLGSAADIDFAIHNGYAYALLRDFSLLNESVLMRFDSPLNVPPSTDVSCTMLFPNPVSSELYVTMPESFIGVQTLHL